MKVLKCSYARVKKLMELWYGNLRIIVWKSKNVNGVIVWKVIVRKLSYGRVKTLMELWYGNFRKFVWKSKDVNGVMVWKS